jgi:hypothetical protein
MQRDYPDHDTLVRYVKARAAERWSIGGTVVVGGLVGIVAAAILAERGVIDPDSGLPPYLVVAPIIVGFLVAVPLVRMLQRRSLGLDKDTQKLLDGAFNRAILRKQDPRGRPPAEVIQTMRAELAGLVPLPSSSSAATTRSSQALARPPVPHFSPPQLASYFAVQRSRSMALSGPSFCLTLATGAATFVDSPAQRPLSLLALAGAVVLALWGYRRHRRIVNATGLSDHDLGTLRGAAVLAGVNGGSGTLENVDALGRGVVEWHRKEYGG